MDSRRVRITVLGVGVLILALWIAGFLGAVIQEGPSNASAKERALDAEEAYLETQLRNGSCVESWGTEATVSIEEEATVLNRTADGVYVEVTHPFWYGTERVESDGGSTALYLVTAESAQRVRGDDVSPCQD